MIGIIVSYRYTIYIVGERVVDLARHRCAVYKKAMCFSQQRHGQSQVQQLHGRGCVPHTEDTQMQMCHLHSWGGDPYSRDIARYCYGVCTEEGLIHYSRLIARHRCAIYGTVLCLICGLYQRWIRVERKTLLKELSHPSSRQTPAQC